MSRLRLLVLAACGVALTRRAIRWVRHRAAIRLPPPPPRAVAGAAPVGQTPLVELRSLSARTGCRILAKLELLNPGGSIKDRVAWRAVIDAERAGTLRRGGTIVEGTSGSTGISLAFVARARGYGCHLVVPDDMSADKLRLLEALGAVVEVVKPASIVNEGHYVNRARAAAAALPGGVFIEQFENPSNFDVHFETTGPEIWEQTGGRIDAFVMGAGTGGTIAGVSQCLKARDARVRVVLADPPGSSLHRRVRHGVAWAPQQVERTLKRHRYDTLVEGVGSDRVTGNFARAAIDDALLVPDEDTVQMAHALLRDEALFVGASGAMNCVAALRTAQALGPGHTVVTVICDGGQRYMTTGLFGPQLTELAAADGHDAAPTAPPDL
ncbi:tryptophan synthase beta subunit-like PLP-dependent enzyme [Pavlovales sp. CCMP2436]|nr:tryptophan synthase beta subunit-like PLP-dependent enzyme [Pavlovales sp. CCMP2436]